MKGLQTYLYYVIIILLLLITYKSMIMFTIFNDYYIPQNKNKFVKNMYAQNNFYNQKYTPFFKKYKECTDETFIKLPYLTKDELIQYNDDIISPPYKKCKLTCTNSCFFDPVFFDTTCSVGQSTGGTSGKSTFVWMNRYESIMYMYTFITSFKKNGYRYGDKIMIYYPAKSYFTGEYIKSNFYLKMLINLYFESFSKIDKATTIDFVNSINQNRPDLIVVFPFVLLQLCININKHKLKLTHYPRNINLSGEYLLNCSLTFCKNTFIGSNIENTYGAVEFGEIAHQIKDNKNTYEVFNQFCYLENKGNNIVVTSLINNTFPIIRYVMEDIGTIVNKDGKQYITDLIGKSTNQIILNNSKFTSLDVDNLIEFVNISDNIISIVIKYDNTSIDINYIVYQNYNQYDQETIIEKTYLFMTKFFSNINFNIKFIQNYEHDYLKKFKIIIKHDNTDSEPVGGYYKY